MLVKMGGGAGGTPDDSQNPFVNGDITFNAPWQVGYEVYDGVLYAEAIIITSGKLTIAKQYNCDLWMIGGGGGSATMTDTYYNYRAGGGSGFTNLALNQVLGVGEQAVTIGAAGANKSGHRESSYNTDIEGTKGGSTSFLGVSANGGNNGTVRCKSGESYPYNWTPGIGGSNGGKSSGNSTPSMSSQQAPGENGTPGAGKIMSRFWDATKNTDYGRINAAAAQGAGWGLNGAGYGAGGTRGALVIRIPIE